MRGARLMVLVWAAAVVIAGCGSSAPASSPLNSALGYLPKDSPFVVSVVTDPNAPGVKGGQAMLAHIPFASFGQAALMQKLQQIGVNYDTDIRPLFGNPLVVGVGGGGSSPLSARSTALFAWVTKDAGTLSSLIQKLRLKSTGSHGGATYYQVAGVCLAVDGATLLAGNSQSLLTSALDRHAAGTGMSTSDFNAELGSLPADALVHVGGNLAPVIASSHHTAVPWLAAIRAYGAAISAGSSGLTFQYTLDTDAGKLTSSQLPVAPGSSPPGFVGTAPVQVGLREPAATLAFALDAERRSSPAKYAAFMSQINAVQRKTGVDFQRDVLGQLGNSAALDYAGSGRSLLARVDIVNPQRMARTLRRLGPSLPQLLGSQRGTTVTPGPAGFETVHSPRSQKVLLGLVGSELVVGTGSPAELRAFAAEPATAAPGAQGALAFRVALPQLIQLAQRRAPSQTVQEVLAALGDITGWVSSSPSALTGSATLGIK